MPRNADAGRAGCRVNAVLFVSDMKRRLSRSEWDQMKVAYASGAGLRELARNAEIPDRTVLARAKREGWTQQIQTAKATAAKSAPEEPTPFKSAAITMQQRGERYQQRIAGVSEKVLSHLESLKPAEILDRAREIELQDRWSRRNYGLDNQPPSGGPINIAFLANPSAVQIVAKPANDPKELKDAQSS